MTAHSFSYVSEMKHIVFICGFVLLLASCENQSSDRSGFVEIKEAIPNIEYDIRYYSNDNFVGRRIDGYKAPKAYLTLEAAAALKKVQSELNKEELGLKVFDAYRPQKAVDHFVRWGKDAEDTLTKKKYYPEINKDSVFAFGYVASKSSHTRGSTVDLTIVDLKSGKELNMGSPWDYFGAVSNHDSPLVDSQQTANRNKLRRLMKKHGFNEYPQEWWHYTLDSEPFPETYFNWDVE